MLHAYGPWQIIHFLSLVLSQICFDDFSFRILLRHFGLRNDVFPVMLSASPKNVVNAYTLHLTLTVLLSLFHTFAFKPSTGFASL